MAGPRLLPRALYWGIPPDSWEAQSNRRRHSMQVAPCRVSSLLLLFSHDSPSGCVSRELLGLPGCRLFPQSTILCLYALSTEGRRLCIVPPNLCLFLCVQQTRTWSSSHLAVCWPIPSRQVCVNNSSCPHHAHCHNLTLAWPSLLCGCLAGLFSHLLLQVSHVWRRGR